MLISKLRSFTLAMTMMMAFTTACGSGGTAPTKEAGSAAAGGTPANGQAANPAVTQPAKKPDKVRFAYFPAFHTMVVFVAEKGGFFKEENLDVEMIYADRGSLQVSMLVSNQVDVATADITSIAVANAQGKNLLHVFPTSQNMSMNFVASNDYLKQAGVTSKSTLDEKLKSMGKMKIGITGPSAPTDLYTRFLLTKAGFNPDKDVQLISLSNAGNLLAALKSKQIDGFMLTPPTPNQPELEGYGTVLIKSSVGEVPELTNYPYQGVTMRKEWAQANPDVATRFVRAVMKANDFIKKNPDKAKEYLRSYFEGMDDKSLVAGMADMIPALPTDGLMEEKFVDNYLNLNKKLGILQIEKLPSPAEGVLWTNEYVKKASQTKP